MSEQLKAKYVEAKNLGHKKVAGEHSLTIGEIVFTIIGILVILYVAKETKVPAKFALPLGIAIIFMGEWMF